MRDLHDLAHLATVTEPHDDEQSAILEVVNNPASRNVHGKWEIDGKGLPDEWVGLSRP
jgi:hypothetical protein